MADTVKIAFRFYVIDMVPELFGHFPNGTETEGTGDIDQYVNPAVVIYGCLY